MSPANSVGRHATATMTSSFAHPLRCHIVARSFSPRIASRTGRRHESTSRRLTKRLRVPPSPSFVNSEVSADHIVFNPPSSSPNVYHTPLIFLPKTDKRRKILEAASALRAAPGSIARTGTSLSVSSTPSTSPSTPGSLPPPVRAPYQKKYHLTEAQIDEIRALRAEDPRKWTRSALASKFGCSELFVALVSRAPAELKEQYRAELEEIKRKWGRRKREAREDRARRRATWGRDA